MDITTFSYYATAGSFFFATMTYWIDFINKKSKISTLKNLLQTELRTIYNGIREDIILYDKVVQSNYTIPFRGISYHNRIAEMIQDSSTLINIFNTHNDLCLFINMNQLMELIKTITPEGLQLSKKEILDFYFKDRLVMMRESLIDLSHSCKFIDLSIMPKKLTGDEKTSLSLEKYKKIQEQENNVIDIINKYCPNLPIRKLSEQYFG